MWRICNSINKGCEISISQPGGTTDFRNQNQKKNCVSDAIEKSSWFKSLQRQRIIFFITCLIWKLTERTGNQRTQKVKIECWLKDKIHIMQCSKYVLYFVWKCGEWAWSTWVSGYYWICAVFRMEYSHIISLLFV